MDGPISTYQVQRESRLAGLASLILHECFLLHNESVLICKVLSGNGKGSMPTFEEFISEIGICGQRRNLLCRVSLLLLRNQDVPEFTSNRVTIRFLDPKTE